MSVCSKNRSSQSCFSWQQKKKSWQCQEAQEYFNPHFLVHIPHLVEHYIVPNTCSSSLLQKNFPHVTLQWWVKFLVLCHLGRFSSLSSPRMYLRNSRHQQYMQWKYCVSQQVWIFTSKSTKFHSLRVDFLTPKIHSYRVDFLKPKSTQLKSRLINSKVLLNQSFHSSELVGTHCMQYYKEGAWVAWAWKTEVHFMAGASSFTKGCAHY